MAVNTCNNCMSLFDSVTREHADWSNATFGAERGPEGALRHLQEEVVELLAEPHDRMEYADAFLLLFDAARRAGIDARDMLVAAREKLEINKKRDWKLNSEGYFKHV